MRISDWSSDVCSSDLPGHHARGVRAASERGTAVAGARWLCAVLQAACASQLDVDALPHGADHRAQPPPAALGLRGAQYGRVADRKSAGWGKSVSVSVDLGGRLIIKKKKEKKRN